MSIAIITGASSGIGKAFAEELDSYNLHEIWIIARREDRLLQLQQNLTTAVKVIQANLTLQEDVNRICSLLSEQKPSIAYLINNAGFGKAGYFADIPLKSSQQMIYLQCLALTELTYSAIPLMQKGGSIINVSSAASFVPMGGFTVYAAVKSYITSFSIGLYRELMRRDIHVCAVCPGPVKTEFGSVSGMSLPDKKNDTLPRDVVTTALKDCKKRKPLSMHGGLVKLIPYLVRILGFRMSSRIIWNFMKSNISQS